MNDAHDVTLGLPPLGTLTSADRGTLVRLLSRVAEHAYRRGVCQAARLEAWPNDLHRWRFGIRLDVSPLLNSDHLTRPSIALLFEHHPRLRAMGFTPPRGMS